MTLPNIKPIDLPKNVSDALSDLEVLCPTHPLVAAYNSYIDEYPTEENAEHIFFRFRPDEEASFDDALTEFLAVLEDALEEEREEAAHKKLVLTDNELVSVK